MMNPTYLAKHLEMAGSPLVTGVLYWTPYGGDEGRWVGHAYLNPLHALDEAQGYRRQGTGPVYLVRRLDARQLVR